MHDYLPAHHVQLFLYINHANKKHIIAFNQAPSNVCERNVL